MMKQMPQLMGGYGGKKGRGGFPGGKFPF